MNTNETLATLLVLKELEVKSQNERIVHLEAVICSLNEEIDQLYTALDANDNKKEEHHLGFKTGGCNESQKTEKGV